MIWSAASLTVFEKCPTKRWVARRALISTLAEWFLGQLDREQRAAPERQRGEQYGGSVERGYGGAHEILPWLRFGDTDPTRRKRLD